MTTSKGRSICSNGGALRNCTNGYPTAVLQANLQDITTVVALTNAARVQRANAVQATESRTRALAALDLWLARYVAVTEYATYARPDLWHKLERIPIGFVGT